MQDTSTLLEGLLSIDRMKVNEVSVRKVRKATMIKVYWRQMAGKAYGVNDTRFQFDDEGYAVVEDRGNARLDCKNLCKHKASASMVGAEEVDLPVVERVIKESKSEEVSTPERVEVREVELPSENSDIPDMWTSYEAVEEDKE